MVLGVGVKTGEREAQEKVPVSEGMEAKGEKERVRELEMVDERVEGLVGVEESDSQPVPLSKPEGEGEGE